MNLGQYKLSVLHINVLNVNVCVQCSVLKMTIVMLNFAVVWPLFNLHSSVNMGI